MPTKLMEYFYAPPENISPHSLNIDGEEFSHLTHVMRKKEGDRFCVVNGVGMAYDVELSETTKKKAVCRILEHHDRLHEPDIDVTLAFGLLKSGSNIDFLIEKCTELGVNTFVPLLTERTIPQHARVDRWQKLALAAMKQSGRCVLPKVRDVAEFSEFVSTVPVSAMRYIPHEQITSPSLSRNADDDRTKEIVICIGPEGGFSDAEVGTATTHGFVPVTLGTRRLRTETAAILACGLVLS
ncbi:MAG: 16S rRNA (uracil(1498)-N(3))-methyltransferase [Ignavibacteriae bacterium]|nr:16S rRNA (uracil(1498)-N(3))-methyltransferase [Ignavibacteriota bacterium]